MSRLSFASHPHLLGFEALDRLVETSAKSAGDAYPPFNIELRGEDRYRITLAVAGFTVDTLAITVEQASLVIRGRQAEAAEGREFLHRGIAARAFERRFLLADRVEVEGASLERGLLHIDLARHRPESRVQTVPIGAGR